MPLQKLDWFQTINIAGETLTAQELRNAIYTGALLSDAKRYFSKNGCVAYQISNKYMNGEMNRQAYLEKAIKWIATKESIRILKRIASSASVLQETSSIPFGFLRRGT